MTEHLHPESGTQFVRIVCVGGRHDGHEETGYHRAELPGRFGDYELVGFRPRPGGNDDAVYVWAAKKA